MKRICVNSDKEFTRQGFIPWTLRSCQDLMSMRFAIAFPAQDRMGLSAQGLAPHFLRPRCQNEKEDLPLQILFSYHMTLHII